MGSEIREELEEEVRAEEVSEDKRCLKKVSERRRRRR